MGLSLKTNVKQNFSKIIGVKKKRNLKKKVAAMPDNYIRVRKSL